MSLELAEGGTLSAALVVAADGRNSIARAAAGIAHAHMDLRPGRHCRQLRATRARTPAITTELHRRAGPLTTVPLPGNASSLVWVEAAGRSRPPCRPRRRRRSWPSSARACRACWARSATSARARPIPSPASAPRAWAQNRIALVGESAHVIPPIGAQGLNLGLRDAAALAECVSAARARGQDIGGPQTLAAYHAARAGDVLARTISVDLLNRSLLTDFLPAQALRGLGLHLLANVAPLRRLAMRGGLSAAGPLPRLMRPGALP